MSAIFGCHLKFHIFLTFQCLLFTFLFCLFVYYRSDKALRYMIIHDCFGSFCNYFMKYNHFSLYFSWFLLNPSTLTFAHTFNFQLIPFSSFVWFWSKNLEFMNLDYAHVTHGQRFDILQDHYPDFFPATKGLH